MSSAKYRLFGLGPNELFRVNQMGLLLNIWYYQYLCNVILEPEAL